MNANAEGDDSLPNDIEKGRCAIMMELQTQAEKNVLLQIQNSKKPHQTVSVVYDKERGQFITDGLKDLFRVKEIVVDSPDVLGSLEEYAMVLSFLLESISTAQDLNLPFGYHDQFEFQGVKYSLYQEGDYRHLKRLA
jgi:hypothetical protein